MADRAVARRRLAALPPCAGRVTERPPGNRRSNAGTGYANHPPVDYEPAGRDVTRRYFKDQPQCSGWRTATQQLPPDFGRRWQAEMSTCLSSFHVPPRRDGRCRFPRQQTSRNVDCCSSRFRSFRTEKSPRTHVPDSPMVMPP